jgi:hypothetical protein
MDDELESLCPGYEGTVYGVSGDEIAFVAPDGVVGLNTVTYVQGVGMNIRTVNVPGSDAGMFFRETEDFGGCQCSPPALWVFTGIESDGTVHLYHTLSSHEAVHMLRHPDHLFNEIDSGGIQENGLTLVAPEYGLDMVTRELVDYLDSLGVGDLKDDSEMSFKDIAEVDVEGLVAKFFENGDQS